MKGQQMTVAEAVQDPSTALGRAAMQTSAERRVRLEAAERIARSEGVSLEEALRRVWGVA